MFVRITSILLIFLTLSSSVTRLVCYAGYELNKDYISKVLCENKAKPILQCKGKCYLSKKIKQAEEQDQKQGSSVSKINQQALLNSYLRFRCYTFQTDEYEAHSLANYFFKSAYAIFQPPKV